MKTQLHLMFLLVGALLTAEGADHFVSRTGTWIKYGLSGTPYTDLQTAVNAAQAGDTVWVEDGFVCDTGRGNSISGYGYPRIDLPNRAITLRSASGYVDEENGCGATIRGEKDPSSTFEDGRGANAIRPLNVKNSDCTIIGFILEDGATGDSPSYGAGGAIYGGCVVSNCLIRNCNAYAGGAVASTSAKLYSCVVSNCYAFGTGYGGGASHGAASFFDCQIVSNRAAKQGGAVYFNNNSGKIAVYSNCVFRGNVAQTAGGGACVFTKDVDRAEFYFCDIVDNIASNGNGGGISGKVLIVGGSIVGNLSTNTASQGLTGGGGVMASRQNPPVDIMPILDGVLVSNNFTKGSGGGANSVIARNCRFVDNFAGGDGGGVAYGFISDCEVVGNVVSNRFATGNAIPGNGGGIAYLSATNCVIAGNSAWAEAKISSCNGGGVAFCDLYNCAVTNNWAGYRGAGAYLTGKPYVCYNCLFAGNVSPAPHVGYDRGMIIEGESANTMPADLPKLYNCTIVDNVASNYYALNAVELHNCVVWNNAAPQGELFPKQVPSEYSLARTLTAGENENKNEDPVFMDGYLLGAGSPAKNCAFEYGWMTDEADVRFRDLAGRRRYQGPRPDMGCFETEISGTTISIY